MDSSAYSELDDLTDLTLQHLNIKKEPTENVSSLTKLTAKYSKSRTSDYVLHGELISEKSNPESTLSSILGSKPSGLKNYSTQGSYSSDDDSSDTGSSLSALAAKHKKNTSKNADNLTFQTKRFKEQKQSKSEDEYSGEEFTSPLAALAAKHKVKVESGSCGLSSLNKPIKHEHDTLISKCQENIGMSSDRRREPEPAFRFADFKSVPDFDDCSQSCVPNECNVSGSLNSPKLKDILAVKHFHRQHSKSESDGFSINNQSVCNKLNKTNTESETSNSLSSLKGSTKSIDNFKFSLGCSIPSSFKSKTAGKGLASSLSNVRNTSLTNLNNSFSDPDVCTSSKQNDTFSGINLSSAIKSPSHTSIPAEDNAVQSEEDEEIVTLLDTLNVDEEMENDLTKDSVPFVLKQVDHCDFNTTDILRAKLKMQTKKCSSFGKLVCKRWKPLKKPYIRNKSFITTVIPFKFTTPSPDDVIAGFLERRQ